MYPPQGSGKTTVEVEGGIPSIPPSGKPSTTKRIVNVYWDEDTQEIVIEYES